MVSSDLNSSSLDSPLPPVVHLEELLSDDNSFNEDEAGFDLRPLNPDHFQIGSMFTTEGHRQQQQRQINAASSRRLSSDSGGGGDDNAEMIGGIQILPSASVSIPRPNSASSSSYSSTSGNNASTSGSRIPLGGSIYLDHYDPTSASTATPCITNTVSLSSAPQQQQLQQPGNSNRIYSSGTVGTGGGSSTSTSSFTAGGSGSTEDNRCDICNKTFTLRTNLTAHKRLHFGETGCPFCEKILSTVGNLRMHIINVHNGNALCPPRRSYVKRQGY